MGGKNKLLGLFLSKEDLLQKLGQVHRGLSSTEGAKKIPAEMAEAQKKMGPLEIVEDYNKRQMFGKTAKGEPIRAAVVPNPKFPKTEPGRLPEDMGVALYPESHIGSTGMPRDEGNYLGGMGMSRIMGLDNPDIRMFPMIEGMYENMMRSPKGTRRPGEAPSLYEIESTEALPRTGGTQYQMMYDMLRAQDDINRATTLSDVNKLRRLGNVMSYGLRHGDYANIAPVSELTKGRGKSVSSQLFDRPATGGEGTYFDKAEKKYLNDLLPPHLRVPIESTVPADIAKMSADEITGLLALREAQMAGTYGPLAHGTRERREVGESIGRISDVDFLRSIAEPALWKYKREPLAFDIEGGIGPNVLGRQLTTENAISRILRGEDPESILADLEQAARVRGQNFKGRYKDGGSIVAF